MTKKSASFPKLSDYLANNDDLNLRATVKAVREAFKAGELDVVQTGEAFKLDGDKGVAKAKAGDKGIIYDFIIFDTDEFDKWLETNRFKFAKQGSSGSAAKMTAEAIIKLRTENPAAYEAYKASQRDSIKTYTAGSAGASASAFTQVANLLHEGKFAEAEVALNGIKTRAGSKNAESKKEYQRKIDDARKQQARD